MQKTTDNHSFAAHLRRVCAFSGRRCPGKLVLSDTFYIFVVNSYISIEMWRMNEANESEKDRMS